MPNAPHHAEIAPGDLAASLVGVSKRLGSNQALTDVDIAVPRGRVVALLGPNGAGKSTAISILVGQRRPDLGRATLFGGDPRQATARRHLGVTPQGSDFPRTLTVRDVAQLVAAHYPKPRALGELLDAFALTAVAGRQTGGLSGGERRRLAIALAFAGNPDLVILDEPTTGLDVAARRAVWHGATAFVEAGGTLVLTTHYLEEAEALAHDLVVIDHGRIRAAGRVTDIRARVALSRVSFAAPAIPDLPGFDRATYSAGRVVTATTDADALVRQLVTSAVPFSELEVRPAPLEDAVLALTSAASP